MKNRAWLGALVVSGAMVLGACSSSTTTAEPSSAPASSSSTAASSAPSPTSQGSNPGGELCTLLKAENAKFADLGKTFGSAFAAKDFPTTKKTLVSFFNEVTIGFTQVEASMASAPADVQAALAVSDQYFAKLQVAVNGASSMQELQTSLTAQTVTPEIKAAGATLDNYVKSQCGDISPPTP